MPSLIAPLLLVTLLALGAADVAAQSGAPVPTAHVLVIDVADPLRPAAQAQQQAFVERLSARLSARRGPGVQVHFENLDLVRFPGEDIRRETVEFLGLKYVSTELDVIVAVGMPGVVFALDLRKRLQRDVPIVGIAPLLVVPELADTPLQAAGVTAILLGNIEDAVVEHALELFPNTRRVVTISDDPVWRRNATETVGSIEQGRAAPVIR